MSNETPPMLPGFDLPDLDRAGKITVAASATLTALQDDGLLEDRHAITCQLLMSLAEAVDRGLAASRVTVATSTLSKQLLETIAELPKPTAGDTDAWTTFQAKLEAVS